jgi:hypothetical protein
MLVETFNIMQSYVLCAVVLPLPLFCFLFFTDMCIAWLVSWLRVFRSPVCVCVCVCVLFK